MRIGYFINEKDKKVLLLCQRVPQDALVSEDNYPGEDPSKRIKEIQDAGYQTLVVWWNDIKDDMESFKMTMDKFQSTNYHPNLNS